MSFERGEVGPAIAKAMLPTLDVPCNRWSLTDPHPFLAVTFEASIAATTRSFSSSPNTRQLTPYPPCRDGRRRASRSAGPDSPRTRAGPSSVGRATGWSRRCWLRCRKNGDQDFVRSTEARADRFDLDRDGQRLGRYGERRVIYPALRDPWLSVAHHRL